MSIVVLISAGRHPVSGREVLPRLEAQAIRLASGLGEAVGLHVGPDAVAAEQALGQGLARVTHQRLAAQADPLDGLVEALAAARPEIVLAGRRGQGGEDTGLLPYAVAARLGMLLVPDVVAARREGGVLIVDQAQPKGAVRRLTVRPPVLLTLHPNAPPPLPYAFGQARRGRVEMREARPAPAPSSAPAIEEKPYRKRPKMMRAAPAGGSAADRLKAVTGEASAGGGAKVLVRPPPEEAAREILNFLRDIGVLAPPKAVGAHPSSAE